jgi:hypothetical protein
MKPNRFALRQAGILGAALLLAACSGSAGDGNPSGAAGLTGVGGSSGASAGASAAGGKSAGGQAGAGTGSPGSAGSTSSGGQESQGGAAGIGGQAGGGGASTAGMAGTGGQAGGTGSCIGKAWGTADPSQPGPFEVVTETNVGPTAGNPDPVHNNMVPQFNLYRPKDLSQGYCHPIITWGNGHADQPKTYEVLIKQLVSHGFVVIASLSSTVSQGTPAPMIVGVNWLLSQADDSSSELYHHLDTVHIGATGHSEGGLATTNAGSDPRILTIAPIAGSTATQGLRGPALLLCGGMDTTVPCSKIQTAFDAISNVPVMMGDNLGDTHGSWIGSIKNPYMVAVTGWMRVQLMGDTALRKMFYGPSCTLCTDTQHWQVQSKMMNQ